VLKVVGSNPAIPTLKSLSSVEMGSFLGWLRFNKISAINYKKAFILLRALLYHTYEHQKHEL